MAVQPVPRASETDEDAHPGAARPRHRSVTNGGHVHGLFQKIAVCLAPDGRSARAMTIACQLASERRTRLAAIAVIQIPLEDPLDASHPNADRAATRAVYEAQAIGDTYGVRTDGVILRAWNPGDAIVAEIVRRGTEVLLMPTEGLQGHKSSSLIERYVVRHAPCRVMLLSLTDGFVPRGGEDIVFVADRESDYWPAGEFVDRI